MKNLLDIPAVEAAAGATAGSLLLWYLSGVPLRNRGEAAKRRARPARLATAALGGTIMALNPMVRSGDWSSKGAFMKSMIGKRAYSLDASSPFMPTVDKQNAYGIVQDDLFLKPFERKTVLDVLSASHPVQGDTTSQYQLMKSAMRAGVTFVPAYAFGRLAGGLLGLSPDSSRKLSKLGALAFAVKSSGLLEQIR